ncbi:hypothetical protein I316_03365 [Kwoniella heveanensis BCC8398]|uniref:ubiquitinyl hydrolase 1 n=1 Tax=Kwoniella heveanensis BCC8398 TaxID=1296120 RepID=A0A1B9GUW0_9TREE|nr:hypothetical protein I316_03365 [Kwoniella heveanensis BCC8398]
MAATATASTPSNIGISNSANTLLNDMLSAPLLFSDPQPRNSTIFEKNMKVVLPGPRSPPPTFGRRGMGLPSGVANGHVPGRTGPGASGNSNGGSAGSGNGARKRKVEEEGSSDEEADDDDDDEPGPSASPSTSTSISNRAVANSSSSRFNSLDKPETPNGTSSISAPSAVAGIPSKSANTPTPSTSKTPQRDNIISKSEVDLTWPEQLVSSKRASAAGLYNPSMACYANATLQVLLHTPPVLRIALAHDETTCLRTKKNLFCMLCDLKNMAAGDHWSGKKKRYAPPVHAHLRYIKKGFSKNRQEDTHEFFRFVTDGLQNTALAGLGPPKDIPEKVKHASWVYKTWGGRVRSRVVCSRCNKPSDTFDWFLDLSLDVNKGSKKSLGGMMAGFTREDKLEGDNKYHCDNCKAKANATKSFKIEQAPPILTLHLKRFNVTYNMHSGRARAEKFNGFIEYGEYLDIAPYMVDPKAGGARYRLFGVTCHRGAELRFGHYTSYVKGPQGQWFNADDDDVTLVSLRQVLNDKTAYLLSYIRISDGQGPTPTKQVNGVVANGYTHDGHSPVANGKLSKRPKSSDGSDESEDEEEEKQEQDAIPTTQLVPQHKAVIGPQQPMVIRKATPPPSPAKRQQAGDDDDSEEEDEDGSLPPAVPKFGSQMKSPKTTKLWQPTPIAPGKFYGHANGTKSPISRPNAPTPLSPASATITATATSSSSVHGHSHVSNGRLSKKQQKRLAKAEKRKRSQGYGGAASPYLASNKMSSSSMNRHGSGGGGGKSSTRKAGVMKRMQRKGL